MLFEKLEARRKEKKMSQKQLANGICEQSQISKMERGNYMPAADLLYKIAQRLEMPIDYFFSDKIEVTSNLTNFKRMSNSLLEDRNYDDLEYLYHLEISKNAFLTLDDTAYLTWIKGLIDFYKDKRQDKAILTLEKALTTLPVASPTYLRILNTLYNFYALVNRDDDYEKNYFRLLQLYESKDLTIQDYLFGYIRVKFNYAHYLLDKAKNLEAVQVALDTIAFYKEKETCHQLAPLPIIVGNAGSSFLSQKDVLNYYLEARDICKIYNGPKLLMTIENYISECKLNQNSQSKKL